MNYLELVQDAIRESGAHTKIPGSLSDLDGLSLLFKKWVANAWEELQIERKEWQFGSTESHVVIDRVEGNINTIVPPDQLSTEIRRNWRLIALRDVYISEEGANDNPPKKLVYCPFSQWPTIKAGTTKGAEYLEETTKHSKPVYYTVDPEGRLRLYPVPDKAYKLEFYAPKAVQKLEHEQDIPFLDPEYHKIIVWRVLMEYGLYHDDRSAFERGRNKHGTYKKRLESSQMPDVKFLTDSLYGS